MRQGSLKMVAKAGQRERPSRGLKQPSVLFAAAIAEIVMVAFVYTAPIVGASLAQSSFESWMMQSESIQRYGIPSFLHTCTASRKLFGRLVSDIVCCRCSIVSFVVVSGWKDPQEWLSAA